MTGISLGGALAAIAGYDLWSKFNLPSSKYKNIKFMFYTFGQPRIGNQEFVDAMKKMTIYRIVHSNDPVPQLPPKKIHIRNILINNCD